MRILLCCLVVVAGCAHESANDREDAPEGLVARVLRPMFRPDDDPSWRDLDSRAQKEIGYHDAERIQSGYVLHDRFTHLLPPQHLAGKLGGNQVSAPPFRVEAGRCYPAMFVWPYEGSVLLRWELKSQKRGVAPRLDERRSSSGNAGFVVCADDPGEVTFSAKYEGPVPPQDRLSFAFTMGWYKEEDHETYRRHGRRHERELREELPQLAVVRADCNKCFDRNTVCRRAEDQNGTCQRLLRACIASAGRANGIAEDRMNDVCRIRTISTR